MNGRSLSSGNKGNRSNNLGSVIMVAVENKKMSVLDTPKSSSCHPDLDSMMMILGCPENRQKTHAQQVMEPSVANQCQKQTKKTLISEKKYSVCVAQTRR
jgi:hypothetical protein